MTKENPLYLLGPILLGIILFIANFINTGLFQFGFETFTVWFSLTLFAFATGWFINKTLGWKRGGKMVFAAIAASVIVSLFMVSFFNDYFGVQDLLSENLVLYALRNIALGVFGFFGMSVSQVFNLQSENEACRQFREDFEKKTWVNEREAELILEEAKLKAEKMVFAAEKKSNSIFEKKARVERQLRELIQVEKELIRKYENEDKEN